jgi:hypothetical protein
VSVGHLSRLLEESGIATVVVCSVIFREKMVAMKVPRVFFTHTPLGRPVGAPGNKATQTKILISALELLESAQRGGSVVDILTPYF